MSDPNPASPPKQQQDPQLPPEQQTRSRLEYNLVLLMLLTLTILIFLVLVMPLQDTKPCSSEQAGTSATAANTNQTVPAANANQPVSTNNSNQPVVGDNTNQSQVAATPDANAARAAALTAELERERAVQRRADCLQYSLAILDRRKDFLAILLTAFGAWVGAGAAYFFGRENLRVAANSLLRMQSQTSTERLRATTIAEVPPKPLDWLVKKSQTVGEVYDKMKAEAERWFIPVVEESGALATVIEEEALYRYIIDESAMGAGAGAEGEAEGELDSPPTPTRDRTIEEVVNHINTKEEFERYRRIFVRVKMDMSVETANELMDRQGIFLAVVIDDKNKPTHFITTAEVRKLLLKTD